MGLCGRGKENALGKNRCFLLGLERGLEIDGNDVAFGSLDTHGLAGPAAPPRHGVYPLCAILLLFPLSLCPGVPVLFWLPGDDL